MPLLHSVALAVGVDREQNARLDSQGLLSVPQDPAGDYDPEHELIVTNHTGRSEHPARDEADALDPSSAGILCVVGGSSAFDGFARSPRRIRPARLEARERRDNCGARLPCQNRLLGCQVPARTTSNRRSCRFPSRNASSAVFFPLRCPRGDDACRGPSSERRVA